MIFKCSLVMMFTGWYRPFIIPIHNDLEITNEVLILMNSYFMLIFSDFVIDKHARYICGWVNLGVICMLVLVNLTLIFCTTGALVLHKVKLMWLKRRQKKLIEEHKAEAKAKRLQPYKGPPIKRKPTEFYAYMNPK